MESQTKFDLELTVIPFGHFDRQRMHLYAAVTFVWIGFLVAAYQAWIEEDWGLLAVPVILFGIGLLIFRGVVFFMNAYQSWSTFVYTREMRKELKETRDANKHESFIFDENE